MDIINDLELVSCVIPDYLLGRQRGLTDEETEKRENRAVWQVYEKLYELEGSKEG